VQLHRKGYERQLRLLAHGAESTEKATAAALSMKEAVTPTSRVEPLPGSAITASTTT
jgi:hypothetical protein